MENDDFIVFKRFNDHESAFELANWLHNHGIQAEMEDSTINFDVAFSNNALNKEYSVKIRQMDFSRADKLLLEEDQKLLDQVANDYYLFEFSNEELIEIIEKQDEWSRFDFLLAQRILEDKGKAIAPQKVEELHEKRVQELSKEEDYPPIWKVVGFIFACMGGILGMFIGWHIWHRKWTNPNGERVYLYKEKDRRDGKIMFYLGIGVTVISIIYQIIT